MARYIYADTAATITQQINKKLAIGVVKLFKLIIFLKHIPILLDIFMINLDIPSLFSNKNTKAEIISPNPFIIRAEKGNPFIGWK